MDEPAAWAGLRILLEAFWALGITLDVRGLVPDHEWLRHPSLPPLIGPALGPDQGHGRDVLEIFALMFMSFGPDHPDESRRARPAHRRHQSAAHRELLQPA
jgi:hypothetical protein